MSPDHTGTEELARKILLHSRRRISHIAPILLEAIYALPEKVRPFPGPLSTDGRALWFHPETVVKNFRNDRDLVARQLLHIISHCLLGHLDLRESFPQSTPFDCAADLKAAQFAEGLCGTDFAANHRSRGGYRDFDFSMHLRPLYESVQKDTFEGNHYRLAADSARFDDHRLWAPFLQPVPAASGGESDGSQPDGGEGAASNGLQEASTPCDAPDWDRIRQSMLSGRFGKFPGACAGMLQENFSVDQRGMSFSAFLRRFASPQERMLLDPDTFDVRWYHLGLQYYGDLPLLEPSELSEPPLPDDIVVALDVSGSCHGETCKRFLKELLGILRDISAGASRFHVLLLLCDSKIQKEILLETPEQVEALFADFTVTGFGGTDFCPVFDRVAQLRADGTLPRIRGLLYLTDGCGRYPSAPADYPTAFLIPAEDRNHFPRGSEWITRLYLNENDFTLKEASAI